MNSEQHSRVRAVFFFVAISGLGWLCDMLTFTLMVVFFSLPTAAANVISAVVGVTFVWFVSLNRVFFRSSYAKGRYLIAYWAYQGFSILLYSLLLGALASRLLVFSDVAEASYLAVAAKILLTPFNLATNYLFMKALTNRMRV